jgi:hypothetical protein
MEAGPDKPESKLGSMQWVGAWFIETPYEPTLELLNL